MTTTAEYDQQHADVELCAPCAAYDRQWANAPVPGPALAIHTMVRSARDVAANRAARAEDHRNLVAFQRALGRRLCAEGKHHRPAPGPGLEDDPQLAAAAHQARAAADGTDVSPAPLGAYRPWEAGLR